MKQKENEVRLLPRNFKIVGWGIVLLNLLLAVLKPEFSTRLLNEHALDAKSVCLSFIILGLLLVSLSKDNVEDERTKQMKANALAGSLVFGAIYAAFIPVLDLYQFMPAANTGQGLMVLLLAGQVGMFYGQKIDNLFNDRKGEA